MCFSSGVYLYFSILMGIKCHEQFEIGCGAILNKIYYYYYETRSKSLKCAHKTATYLLIEQRDEMVERFRLI